MAYTSLWQDIRSSPLAIIGALVLHLVLIVLLSISLTGVETPRVQHKKVNTIQAVVIDTESFEKELQKLKKAGDTHKKQAEKEKQKLLRLKQLQLKEKRRLAEMKKQQKDLTKKLQIKEKRRLVELEEQRKKEEKKRKEMEQARAQAKKKKEDEIRRKAAEVELKKRLEEESILNAKKENQRQKLRSQYVMLIEQKVARNWLKPATSREGLSCEVMVQQTLLGDVTNVQVMACEEDPAFRRSIEHAVRKSSPLPPPPSPDVFDKHIRFTFRPQA